MNDIRALKIMAMDIIAMPISPVICPMLVSAREGFENFNAIGWVRNQSIAGRNERKSTEIKPRFFDNSFIFAIFMEICE